ncbi:MAG: hypothetical protein ACREFO_14255 [Acetobacteraceae bacterium]
MSYGHNKEFLKDPAGYLGGITILTIGTQFLPNQGAFQPQVAKGLVYMDLVATDSGATSGNKQGRADFNLNAGSDSAIAGGWIPYVDEGTVNGDSAKLPVQELAVNGVPKFCFTGAMNGCSLVLASKGGKNYGIHVPNSTQAKQGYPVLQKLGYQHVKSLDYFELSQRVQGNYGTKVGESRDAPGGGWYNTFAFFVFDGGTWKIMAQPQIVTQVGLDAITKSGAGVTFVGTRNGAVIVV